jgi:hypothetical protein
MVLMISYDLNGHERPKAYEVVKSFIERNSISWARPLRSQWFVETSESPNWWTDQLRKLIDQDDRLFICRIPPNTNLYQSSYQGYLTNEIWNWLNPRVR